MRTPPVHPPYTGRAYDWRFRRAGRGDRGAALVKPLRGPPRAAVPREIRLRSRVAPVVRQLLRRDASGGGIFAKMKGAGVASGPGAGR